MWHNVIYCLNCYRQLALVGHVKRKGQRKNHALWVYKHVNFLALLGSGIPHVCTMREPFLVV